jgi:3-oxoacyl-[acyl-carrier protein] reductase
VSRDRGDAEARALPLREGGAKATGYATDLADTAATEALASAVAAAHGPRVDALVLLAGGYAASGPVGTSAPDEWQHQFRINVTTAYTTTRAFLPGLRASRGAIVYVSSAAALPGRSVANISAYAAAKGAVLALMRAVAAEERGHGVRANAIAPTSIRTRTNLESMGNAVRYVEREDVAGAVCFLCSDAARAISGQVIELA